MNTVQTFTDYMFSNSGISRKGLQKSINKTNSFSESVLRLRINIFLIKLKFHGKHKHFYKTKLQKYINYNKIICKK